VLDEILKEKYYYIKKTTEEDLNKNVVICKTHPNG